MKKIAIIGMSGLFPGSSTLDEFWNNLMEGKDLISLSNESDFGVDPNVFYQKDKGVVDKCYSIRGGYIRDFKFDPAGYKLPVDYLAKQDKLYQWPLYVAKEALADSGYLNKEDILRSCGLVLGNLSFPTGSSHKQLAHIYTDTLSSALKTRFKSENFDIPSHKGNVPNNEVLTYTPSGMVAEALGLGASHFALDAACASSLYAIKLACDELELGKADIMLAGAVCASDQLFIHMGFSIFQAYCESDQKFVPLDKNSAGLVSAEGAGMVVLKRLEDAERDGDNILGVIGGIGLSNDGAGKFLLSPNPKGQLLSFQRAYEREDVNPHNTQYLECHATGTPLGDVTEMNSICTFFEQYQTKPLLGSVKSNMGHLLTAAGMTGLLKVLLSIQKEIIPPNINLEDAIEASNDWVGKEEMILAQTQWKDQKKQAGINSFGFGGTNAHMVVQNYATSEDQYTNKNKQLTPLSITGMDVHFGDCKNLEEFYSTIFNGKQHFRELPKERWKGFEENKDLLKSYGFENGEVPKGAYIEDFEIDLLRYKIQPKEAETLEPQQALILKVADNAIKDAGLSEGANVAVIIAMEPELGIHQYLARWDVEWQIKEALKKSGIELSKNEIQELENYAKDCMFFREGSQSPSQHTSFVGNIMASRIASLWDFSGPAFTISDGVDSAFKALDVAQNMLSLGEVDAVVLGGVDFAGGLENVLLRNKMEAMYAGSNPGLSYGNDKPGWVIGEGAGALVLKRSTEAKAEKTYARIDALAKADFRSDIAYLELAATGFSQEGKNECQQLIKFAKSDQKIALGSVKANIGHVFAASGIAALVKTALCLKHKFIPGLPQWKNPNPALNFESTNYYFPKKSRPWILESGQEKRKAAVNATNDLQVIMSEEVKSKPTAESFIKQNLSRIIPLKGNNDKELVHQLSALEIALDSGNTFEDLINDFIQKANQKTSDYALTLVANNANEFKQEINFFKKALSRVFAEQKNLKTPRGSYFTANPLAKKGKLAFVYPGSSTAYSGLGRDLFQIFPELYAVFNEMEVDLQEYFAHNYLFPKSINEKTVTPSIYDDSIAMMSVGVLFSTTFTKILRDILNIQPEIAFGYSMGECSSMWYALGLWSADETREFRHSPIFKNRFAGNLELLAEEWQISTEEAKQRWVSMVLLAPRQDVEQQVSQYDKVYTTFVNTENEIVISGDKKLCLKIAENLACQSVLVPFQNVIHHDFCAREKDGLIKMHHFPLMENPAIDFYSSISKSKIPLDAMHIAENSTAVCMASVDFPGTIEAVYNEGARIFIEVGANSTCTGWISSILKEKEHLAISIDHKGKSSSQSIVELLAQLYSHGLDIDLSAFYQNKVEQNKKRSFYKKITPGGRRIYDSPLREELVAKIANATKKSVTQPALSLAMANSGSIEGTTAEPFYQKKSKVKMETKHTMGIVNPTAPKERIGENGLKLQDYSTGEQLKGKEIIFSQEDLEEFATGKIANVFGPEYDVIDTYSRRVMLPSYPYLLVSRVTGLKGKMGEYKPSTMQTEYDIPYDAWFTTDRQIPWAVSVESGQCDLLLISYLGIDFENKGNLVYRLLDCTLTFVDDLPFEGQTLRYDISINSFVKNADNLLFFFSYRCYVEDRLVLKMDGGCAGFFSDEQLEEGSGVVYSQAETQARLTAEKKFFTPLLKTTKTSFSKEDLRHLINGDMEKCFGDVSYFANSRNPSLCLPPEKILMLDRIVSVDIKGGAYGLGYIVAEKDLQPDDWYFPCHFRDDEVLAGSLQAEGGGNLLRFFMLMLGLQRLMKDARYQPIFDVPQKVRCRKQVTPKDTKLVYILEVKEIGLIPNPYVIADLEILSDDVVTVHFENLGLQLREKDNPKYLDQTNGIYVSPRSKDALLDEKIISEFALGSLSKCFGDDFKVYDGKPVSHQPNTDLQVISRVLSVDGERRQLSKPSTIITEYDVPEKVWYYDQNNHPTMPYSILMEIALQPCGFLGAYLGSTLQYPDKSLFFRNLDGEGETFALPQGTDFRGKVITNKSVMTSSVSLGGTILQNYTFELTLDGHLFYKGKSSFGFFPKEMLADQIGLDSGKMVQPWFVVKGLEPKDYMQIKLDSLFGKMKLYKAPEGKPHFHLAKDQLNLLDKLLIAKEGGNFEKGYVHATRKIKSYDWFFTCHFYEDPVMPGSLGIEAIMQAIQVFALQQDLGKEFNSPRFVQLDNHKTVWKYRGQILQHVDEMQLEVHVKSIEKRGDKLAIITDASLWNDEVRIYQITDLALGIEEA